MKTPWMIQENVDYLRSAWIEGIHVNDIAYHLGVSRNAVVGKARRLNLGLHPNARGTQDHRSDLIREKVKRKRVNWSMRGDGKRDSRKFIEPIFKSLDHKCTLVDLKDHSCRYPLWHTEECPEMFFCGVPEADVNNGRPYCQFHTVLCVVHLEPKMLEAAE
jgi:GcrA cell cycle regulator